MDDLLFMNEAFQMALRGEGHTRPNPPVGAVIVNDGRTVGRGWHRRAGGDHAEVAAIKDARRKRANLQGATIYVTLEPCSRAGRVGACTDAIIASGITRVVYGCKDPNPMNRGRAKRVLAKHGICCECLPKRFHRTNRCSGLADLHQRLSRLIAPFSKLVTSGFPYVTVKLAMSLDGKICDRFGNAKWISSEAARNATGKLRERVDAIMVGAETVRRDNPSLLSHGVRNDDLVRVVVTRSGKLPREAQIFTDGRNETLVYRRPASLREVLQDLGRRGFTHVLCEGGLVLATALAEEGLVDEWLTVIAPKVLGGKSIGEAMVIKKFGVMADDFPNKPK